MEAVDMFKAEADEDTNVQPLQAGRKAKRSAPSFLNATEQKRSRHTTQERCASSGISFQFPGWNTCFEAETPAAGALPDLLDDLEELDLEDAAVGREAGTAAPVTVQPGVPDIGTQQESDLRQGRNAFLQLPEDLLLRILGALTMQDLLRCGQSCSSWHAFIKHDDLWEQHSSQPDLGWPGLDLVQRLMPGDAAAGVAAVREAQRVAVSSGSRKQLFNQLKSHFMDVVAPATQGASCHGADHSHGTQLHLTKHLYMAAKLDHELHSLWRIHITMRSSLCQLWRLGEAADTALLRCVILQLTRYGWSLCYEALHGSFQQISDAIALELLNSGSPLQADGMQLWDRVLQLWQRYNGWLQRIAAMCDLISQCISAERAAEFGERGRVDTPSLSEAGRLAFRSQVLLRYGLRSQLQSALLDVWLRADAADSHFLKRVKRLLLDLDVMDDGTAAKVLHTRSKFREVYGLEPGPLQLQIQGQLRLPPRH